MSKLNPVNYKKIATLDLDGCDNEKLHRIVSKVLGLKCSEGVSVKPSTKKGYHLTVYCKTRYCSLCRLVFDDPWRFRLDEDRPWIQRNVLWDYKTPARDALCVKS